MNQIELRMNLKVLIGEKYTYLIIITVICLHNCFYIVDKLAGRRWRSKLGRPSKVPTLGDVDPTGTYCPVPEDWLKKKYGKIRQ